MADYRIDVHRGTVTVTGSASGKLRGRLWTIAPVLLGECDGSEKWERCDSSMITTAPWGGYVKVEQVGVPPSGNAPASSGGSAIGVGILLTAYAGYGAAIATQTLSVSVFPHAATATPPSPLGGTDVTVDWTADYEFVIDLETFQTLVEGGFPTYGGAASIDSPPQGDLYLYERPVPGSSASASITGTAVITVVSTPSQSGGSPSGTATSSIAITTHEPLAEYAFEGTATAAGIEQSVTCANSIADWLGASRPSLTCTSNAGGATGTATVGGLSATAVCSCSGNCQSATASAVFIVAPDRKAMLKGVVRRMEDAYPSAVLRVWNGLAYEDVTADSDGAWEKAVSQKNYSGFVSTTAGDGVAAVSDSDNKNDAVYEWGAVWAELKASWLASEGLESTLWPVVQRAYAPYNSFSLVQASEVQVSSGHSGAGAGDISRTLSLANGADAGIDGTSWAGFSLRGYAYLVVRIKASVADSPFTVKIGSKEWSRDKDGNALKAGTSFMEFWIDLLCPTNSAVTADGKDSRYPYSDSSPITVADSDLFGCSNVTAIVLTDLAAATYTVDWIKLKRNGYSRATVCHGFNQWVDVADDDPDTEYNVRLLELETDGCRDAEHIAFYRQLIASVYVYTHRTLSQLSDSINGAPPAGGQPADGWTAVAATFDTSGCAPVAPALPQLSPCWLNNDRYAAWCQGSGAIYSSGAWVYGFDLDCSVARQMQAQMLYHRLLWWPPALDPLELESSPDADGIIQLRAATILRAQDVGVVSTESGKRAPGVTVTIGGGDRGVGVTGADGTYQTGTPYPAGGTTETVEADVGESPPSLSTTFYTRARQRGAFRVVLISGVFYYVYEDWHGQLHAVAIDNGNVRYYRSDSSLPIPNWAVNGVYVTGDADTPGSDDNPVVVRNWQDALCILFDRGGDTYETLSMGDDGATWSTPTVAIAGGTRPFTVCDRNGNQLEAAYVSGAIQARFRGAGDTDWSDLFSFTDSMGSPLAVEDEPFSFDAAYDSPERWVLSVVIDGETASSLWWSADEGSEDRTQMSWTRVT